MANKRFSKLKPRQKKKLLSELIKKIVVYKDKVAVEYLGEKTEENLSGPNSIKGSFTFLLGAL